jgi:AraC family transcriptional regulator
VTSVRSEDRLRRLVDVLVESVDSPAAGAELARRAYLSRFHFDRLVHAVLGETPAVFRRRLLLERAAYELAESSRSVTEIGLDAGYGSLEAFTRAFRRVFGVKPTEFRAAETRDFRAPAPNGVHFHPPGGVLVPGDDARRKTMDLVDRMVEHDNWVSEQLLGSAGTLDCAALDEPVALDPPSAGFSEDAPSIRAMLNRLVFTKEMWSAAIAGRSFEESHETSLEAMRARLETAGAEFAALARDIRDRGAWDTAFVDATCEPPETFTFGAAVAHVLVWNARRHEAVAGALAARGVETVRPDPIAWERSGLVE